MKKNGKTSLQDRVPFREKLALGVGGFSSLFGYISINTVARTLYVMILGVNAAWETLRRYVWCGILLA